MTGIREFVESFGRLIPIEGRELGELDFLMSGRVRLTDGVGFSQDCFIRQGYNTMLLLDTILLAV